MPKPGNMVRKLLFIVALKAQLDTDHSGVVTESEAREDCWGACEF